MALFKGVGAAMVTPFDTDGNVDLSVLEDYANYLIDNGTDALIPLGTTGEPCTLSAAEYETVAKTVITAANGRVPVIVGAGSNCTAKACENTALAKRLGADGVLVVTPYYNKCTQNGLIEHYRAVAAIGLPIIVYNVPSRTGVTIQPQTLEKLAQINGIVGVKEANGDIAAVMRTAEICERTGLSMYCGNDELTAVEMSLGASGVISVAANPAPKQMKNLLDACLKNDYSAARKIQFALDGFISALFCEVNPIPVKKAMQLIGIDVGTPRLPLTELESAHIDGLRAEMKNLGLVK